jgi:hypothetical protein
MPLSFHARLVAAVFLQSLSAAAWNFTVFSDPVTLRYGEVYQRGVEGASTSPPPEPLPFPADVVERYAAGDKTMAVTGFDVDMVRFAADGVESRVPLSSHYLHHYALFFGERRIMRNIFQDRHMSHLLGGCHIMKGAGPMRSPSGSQEYDSVFLGSASGAEYRHNPQRYAAPFRVLLSRPEVWSPYMHIINTNSDLSPTRGTGVSPLLECPCTPQRKINATEGPTGTIDGKPPFPPIQCSPEFAATGNPSCSLSTYVGGFRCCEDGVFLIDTDKECLSPDCSEKSTDTVHMKFTFYYEDAQPDARQLEQSACCDTTADQKFQGNENIEYDVPACAPGTSPDKCIHITESLQPVGHFEDGSGHLASDLVDLVFASPHIHYGGISLELIDPATNKTLCEVHRTNDGSGGVLYGRGSAVGDEDGYLVGLRPCSWGGADAPRFRRDHLLRTRAVYDASKHHTGVMALWLMSVSAVAGAQDSSTDSTMVV